MVHNPGAKVDFSKFNIGAMFKLAQMQDLSGESALAGTVTVEGSLARSRQEATGASRSRRCPQPPTTSTCRLLLPTSARCSGRSRPW